MKETLDKTLLADVPMTREQVNKTLAVHLQGCVITLNEILQDKELFMAVADIYWKRYQAKQQAPEIDFKAKPPVEL